MRLLECTTQFLLLLFQKTCDKHNSYSFHHPLFIGVQLQRLQQHNETSKAQGSTSWKKKSAKNRPVEAPTKRPIGGFEKASYSQRKKGFDPRFESLCGKYERHHFNKSYGFLSDWIDEEQKQLESRLESTKDPMELNSLKIELSRLKKLRNRVLKETNNRRKESKLRQSSGKRIFISQRKANEESMKDKYEALKKSGKLKEYIEKRRKKQASKDRRLLPTRRKTNMT
ncbi:Ribosomal RNA processing protein 36 [Galdieria sulphuraria]|nr:Ribosomal RNA processing protein 36 [Galdieria sulphuraria]